MSSASELSQDTECQVNDAVGCLYKNSITLASHPWPQEEDLEWFGAGAGFLGLSPLCQLWDTREQPLVGAVTEMTNQYMATLGKPPR